jgi:hypothetical protein
MCCLHDSPLIPIKTREGGRKGIGEDLCVQQLCCRENNNQYPRCAISSESPQRTVSETQEIREGGFLRRSLLFTVSSFRIRGDLKGREVGRERGRACPGGLLLLLSPFEVIHCLANSQAISHEHLSRDRK